MRITIPVSGDVKSWMSHFPEINFDPEKLLDEKGMLIIPKVVELFKQSNEYCESTGFRPMFQIGSEDGFNVYSMTIEFLRQVAAVTHWIENRPGSNAHVSSDGSAVDRRLERRMGRGQVAFGRVDIRDCATGVKFIVGYGNPDERVIGNCESGAREFAIYMTRILLCLADSVNEQSRSRQSTLVVTVVGRDPALVEEARRREVVGRELDKVRAANEKRKTCANNVGGFCSPACPSCRCYRNGSCVEAELPEEYRD